MGSAAKLLVIGVDAADSRLIEKWSDRGLLPTFRGLGETAARIPTLNPPGIYTGAIWPSFFTGVSPARHGRYFARQLRTGTYRIVDFHPDETRFEPFWDTLTRAGRRLALIDVPKAPLAARLDGLQIADWCVHDPDGPPRSQPSGLIDEILGRFGSDPVVGSCDLGRPAAAPLGRLRDALVERVRRKTALSAEYLARGGWDLFLTVFTESHCAGHQLWHVHDVDHPRHRAELRQSLGDPLLDVYVALDQGIGRLLEVARADATVLVYASHGMGAHYDGTFLLDDVLRRLDGIRPPRRLPALELVRHNWRRTPTVWRRRLRPLADWMYDAAHTSERSRRRFFVVPTNDNCAGIRVNLIGREPHGRVKPGADYEAVCRELSSALHTLVEIRSGRPVVRDVLRTAELFAGEHLADLPDLLVRWHRDAPIAGVVSPAIGRIEREYRGNRTGDHRAEGVLFARGPGIAPTARHAPVAVEDIAPTIAAMLGARLADVDGCPIPGLLEG